MRKIEFVAALVFMFSFFCVHKCQPNCSQHIGPGTVADSWQSSSHLDDKIGLLCFKNISTSAAGSYRFFHTAVGNSGGSQGYHWLVVKLKQLTLLTSVTVASRTILWHLWNREPFEPQKNQDVRSRSSNIEVWTSASANLQFGSDHCSSRDIIQHQILGGKNDTNWKYCGITDTISDDVMHSQQLNVVCAHVHLTRFLLLRKFVGAESRSDRQCMSFNDMWISSVNVTLETYQTATSGSVNETRRFLCSKSCTAGSEPKSVSLRLCDPKGQCSNSSETQISVHDSFGNFTCRVDGQVVSWREFLFQYPPRSLKISAAVPRSCSDESPADATFTFVTSAAVPAPEHRCVASSSGDWVHLMKLPGQESGLRGDARSDWLCANCSRATAKVTVNCSAVQLGYQNSSAEIHWGCENETDHVANSNHHIGILLLASVLAAASSIASAAILFRMRSLIQRRGRRFERNATLTTLLTTENSEYETTASTVNLY